MGSTRRRDELLQVYGVETQQERDSLRHAIEVLESAGDDYTDDIWIWLRTDDLQAASDKETCARELMKDLLRHAQAVECLTSFLTDRKIAERS